MHKGKLSFSHGPCVTDVEIAQAWLSAKKPWRYMACNLPSAQR
jgi:hypothetical protein